MYVFLKNVVEIHKNMDLKCLKFSSKTCLDVVTFHASANHISTDPRVCDGVRSHVPAGQPQHGVLVAALHR